MRRGFAYAAAFVLSTVVLAAAGRPAVPLLMQVATPAGFPAVGATPIIRLISAGAEPRQVLRYKVPAGFKGRMDMTMSMALHMELAGMSLPDMVMPKMTSSVEIAVTGVSASGDMSVRAESIGMKFDMTGVDPMMASALQNADLGAGGVVLTGVTDPRGVARDMVVDTSKITNPQVKQLTDQMSAALKNISSQWPEEAVGVGAKWESRVRLPSNGIDAFQTATMEIASIEGRKVRLKVSVTQTAPPQAANIPNMPPGASAQIREFSGTGGGTTLVDLDSLVAEGDLKLTLAIAMDMSMEGTSQSMTMTTTVESKMTPVK